MDERTGLGAAAGGARWRAAIRLAVVAAGLAGVLVAAPVGAQDPAAGADAGAGTPSTTITIGESNTAGQRGELLTAFGVGPETPTLTVTLADTNRAMDGIFDTSGITSAYSSTALTCGVPGSGLVVTTRNITVVTPGLYAMALATAGIDDATLTVAAPPDAAAEGMTALAGVFATWDAGPCPSGATDPTRQRLALEELALTAEIGAALGTEGGVATATDLVLGAQREIVLGRLTDAGAVGAAVAAQEEAAAVAIPEAQRTRLVDLLTRLGQGQLAWGTFAAGWEIGRDAAGTAVTMTGAAVGGLAAADPTATASAPATATALPAPTPTPTPTAEAAGVGTVAQAPPPVAPAPYTVRGRVSETAGGRLGVVPDGATAALGFAIDGAARVTRAGTAATIGQVRAGDAVTLTIDGATRRAVVVAAEPPPAAGRTGLAKFWPLLLALLLLPLAVLAWLARRGRGRVLGYLVPAARRARPAATATTVGMAVRRVPVGAVFRGRWSRADRSGGGMP